MLLMQSDVLKALWFMIFPVVDFVHGPIKSSSSFCQVSGFFLSVGIEASDVAVLLIAIHTALYIFRPKQPNGKNGLYPFRRWAYGAYVAFPLLMASLAFLHGPTPYANVGEFCYLPLKPSWPRAFLSWIPRFVLLLSIVLIYVSIYTYVSSLMKRFSRQDQTAGPSAKLDDQHASASNLPTAPRPVYQGSAAPSRRQSYDVRDRRDSASTLHSIDFELGHAQYEAAHHASDGGDPSQPSWKWMELLPPDDPSSSQHHDPTASYANLCESNFAHRDISNSEHDHLSQESTAVPSREGPPCFPPPSASTFHWGFKADESRIEFRRPSYGSTASSNMDDLPPMADARHKVRQQLRLLFIYPLVYIVIWIAPFASHVLTGGNDDDEAPYPIVVLSLISLCIQGAANSLLFSIWEKPWRHTRGDNIAGFRVGQGAMVGRTREEMMVDGRIARMRLGVEIEERKRREKAMRGSRHWWEMFDVENGDHEELLTR